MSKRIILAVALIFISSFLPAAAQKAAPEDTADGEVFNRDVLITKAVKLSKQPYQAPADDVPQELKDLTYDQHRDIRFVRENGPWYGKRLPFEVQFFHLGSLFQVSVPINEVIDGKAKVNVGDAVVKGQELVSGILRNDEFGFITTAARGAVSANVIYVVSAKAGPTIEKLSLSGTGAYYNAVKLFGICIADEPEYASYTDETVCEYELTGCILPLKAERRLRQETIVKQSPASRQELEQAAAAKAQDKLNELIPHSATIISKHTEYETDADDAVTAIIRIMTEENIAEARGIYGQQ